MIPSRRALLLVLALAGCAPGLSRQAYLDRLVGLPETEVVRVMGVPSRSYETGGRKFLAFTEQRTDVLPGFYGGGFGFWGGGYGGFGAIPPVVQQRICETTLEITGGRVADWSLRGDACG